MAKAIQTIEITVVGNPLIIVSGVPPEAEVGKFYEFQFMAGGGNPPYVWMLHEDTLPPPGLELRSDGKLIGVPELAGIYNFTIEVEDSQ